MTKAIKTRYGCENCGKTVQFVNRVSHAKNRMKTIRRPNLHTLRVVIEGKTVKQTLCVKCGRRAIRPQFSDSVTAGATPTPVVAAA